MNLLHLVTAANSESRPLSSRLQKLLVETDKEKVSSPTDIHDKSELRERLTPIQYNVTQLKDTERPFSGSFIRQKTPGIYNCVVCDAALFHSGQKYDSGHGWPSFYDVIRHGAVHTRLDNSMCMNRVEVTCAKCGAHLGHVFDDGPRPTGLRYCINSVSMKFLDESDNVSNRKPFRATEL